MYQSTITLKFNTTLREDPKGLYSVFYGDKFNTPDASLIREGSTHQVSSVSFCIPNFPPGREIAFMAIGMYSACYVENIVMIEPGHNEVWLAALEETFTDV